MVERQLPKLDTRVRFPSPAPAFSGENSLPGEGSPIQSVPPSREGTLRQKGRVGRSSTLPFHFIPVWR